MENLEVTSQSDVKNYRGYIKTKKENHPAADIDGYVLQHKLVMEEYIGQILPRGYVVHHLDRNRTNNKIENLLLIPNNALHSKLHGLLGRCPNKYEALLSQLQTYQTAIKDNKPTLVVLFKAGSPNLTIDRLILTKGIRSATVPIAASTSNSPLEN